MKDKQLEKELRKELETPQEKFERRLKKKEDKARKKAEQEAFLGYSNESNPFNDTNLSETFVWKKKNEKLQSEGRLDPQWKKAMKRKREELRVEIDEVKQRRFQREREKALAEQQRAELQRQEEARNAIEFEKKGEKFEALQLRQRRERRFSEGRTELIDLLSKNLDYLLCPQNPGLQSYKLEMSEPFQIVSDPGTTVEELRALWKDLKILVTYYNGLLATVTAEGFPESDDMFYAEDSPTTTPVAAQYWNSLLVVVEDELQQRTTIASSENSPENKPPASSAAASSGEKKVTSEYISSSLLRQHHGIHDSVVEDVILKLQQKTPQELGKMEEAMSEKVRNGGGGVDVDYWSTILKHCKLLKAKAHLREIHAKLMEVFVQKLKERRQGEKAQKEQRRSSSKDRGGEWDQRNESDSNGDSNGSDNVDYSPRLQQYDEDDLETEDRSKDQGTAQKRSRDHPSVPSAQQRAQDHSSSSHAFVDAEEADITKQRLELLAKEKIKHLENEKMQMEAAKKMGIDDRLAQDETLLCDEFDLGVRKFYDMSDRFRPRKPKYFNRVHTGYEWNKYNRTHYDYENPPPKVVMGYKFNIFYPDLADPTRQQPIYFLEPTEKGWSDDVCIIRFHAGPPYEDIAFKIVNRRWDHNSRKGFRYTFERGVLHLYFNFERYFYRR